MQSKGLSRVFSNTTVQKHQFFGAQLSLASGCLKKVKVLVARLCQTVCNPMDCSPPGSPLHGIFQARVLEWGVIAFSDELAYPSPTPRACSNSCPLSQRCHPIISSSVVPFSFCPQSFPALGSSSMSQLFALGGQRLEFQL